MASNNRASGEAKILLLLAGIVLLGGGALLGMNKLSEQSGGPSMVPTGAPTPVPDPQVISAKEFDLAFSNARHVKGPEKAPLQVIEFADFECPSCRRAYNSVVEQMLRTRPVRIAFFHLPLEMHQYAMPAAVAAEAAAKQGKFWEMYAKLFTGPERDPDLSVNALEKIAKEVGLDMTRFQQDAKDPALQDLIRKDMKVSSARKITSTPTFMVRGTGDKAYVAIGGQQFQAALKMASGSGTPSGPPMIAPGAPGNTAPGPLKPVM